MPEYESPQRLTITALEVALHTGPFLAAAVLQPLSENSRLESGTFDSELRQVVALAKSMNALGLTTSLYDDGRGSRSTGKERDSESGLDYFGARYYGSALGRWGSPDAINLTDERMLSPSNTINKYVYGGNNPFREQPKEGAAEGDSLT